MMSTYTFQVLDSNETEIVKTCGRSIPGPILSSSNMLTIVFKSDESRAGTGFLVNWSRISIDGDIIFSKNYPLQYQNEDNQVKIFLVHGNRHAI